MNLIECSGRRTEWRLNVPDAIARSRKPRKCCFFEKLIVLLTKKKHKVLVSWLLLFLCRLVASNHSSKHALVFRAWIVNLQTLAPAITLRIPSSVSFRRIFQVKAIVSTLLHVDFGVGRTERTTFRASIEGFAYQPPGPTLRPSQSSTSILIFQLVI